MTLRNWETFLYFFIFSYRYFAKGKDICKILSFGCLTAFLRKNIKDLKIITYDEI